MEALHDVTSARMEVSSDAVGGRSLGDLAVCARTGASVVALRRGGEMFANPSAEQRLEPGNRVLAIGDAEALARLSALLSPAS